MESVTLEKVRKWIKINPKFVAMLAANQKPAQAGEHPIIEVGYNYAEVPVIEGLLEMPEVQELNGKYKWPATWHNEGSNYVYGTPGPIRW